ncbi:MAG: zinc-dependent alcohol dehydrogenase family protein [Aliidongia sp.]
MTRSATTVLSRSVRIREFGGPEVLRIEEVAIPAPGPAQVRLRIRAIGLNRTEATFRAGRSAVLPSLPSQIGFEAVGEIEALGPDVDGFAPGEPVGLIPAYSAGEYGLYGEVALAPARSLVRLPADTAWETAAATWVAFATAWGGMIDLAGLSSGQVVLIPAASSSVGLAAIQVARRVGAVPVALTRTGTKAAALRDAGAELVIASQEQNVVAEVQRLTGGKGAELIFDPVAGPGFGALVEATASGGTLIVYGALGGAVANVPVMPLLGRGLTLRGFGLTTMTRSDKNLAALKHFVEDGLAAGALRPTIAKTFRFDEIVEAHRYLEAGEQIGKIVVTV